MAGVDLEYINQRQAEIAAAQAARSMGGVPYWNPPDGSSKVRLMPPWGDNVRSFERSQEIHFGVGPEEQVFPCAGHGCPVCAHVQALRATNDPGDLEMGNRMAKKRRYFSNVVDLGDSVWTQKDYQEYKTGNATEEPSWSVGQTKVQVWGYGAMIYGQLINMFAQLQTDLTDLQRGYDLVVTKIGTKLNTKYTVIPAMPRPFLVAGQLTLHNLDGINPARKTEDMLAALQGTGQQGGGTPPPAMPVTTPPPALPPARQPVVNTLPPPAAAVAAAHQSVAAPAAPAPAAAAPRAVQTLAPSVPAVEPLPECFKDKTTFSTTDTECTGDGHGMDKCPGYQDCGEFAGKLVAAPKGRRRASKAEAAAATAAPAPTTADDLEAQMQAALGRAAG